MPRKPYSPRPYAVLAAKHLAAFRRCALWAKPGLGKTVMALSYLDALMNVLGEPGPALVVAPLRVARDVWADEAAKWDHLRGIRVSPVLGTPAQRKAALRRDANVFVTNYEQLPWLVAHYGTAGWPFRTVVADESTKLKGFRLRNGGQRAAALGRVAHRKVDRWINLTGTPASNGLLDLWGQTWFLDAGDRLGRTFGAFHERWFTPLVLENSVKWIPTKVAQQEIGQRLSDICLTIDPKDWFDLREPVVTPVFAHLSKPRQAEYEKLKKELFLRLAGGETVTAVNAMAASMKCHQFANGAVYAAGGEREWAEVHDEKIEALRELVEDTGDEPLLTAITFRSDRDRLMRAFPGLCRDLSTPEGLAAAKRGEGKIWIGHPKSVAHGVDGLQQFCATVVFFSVDWSAEEHDQFLDRVGPVRQMQAATGRQVMVYYLLTKGTIDEVIYSARVHKTSVQDALLNYSKGMV